MPGKLHLRRGNCYLARMHHPSYSSLEILEGRIAPARAFALAPGDSLRQFDTEDPDTFLSTTAITGIPAGADIVAIDFRPANGLLYALGSNSRLYTLDTTTAVATPVGPAFTPALAGTSFGFDFNPETDQIRVTSDTGAAFRLNPGTGAVVGGAIDGTLGLNGLNSVAFSENHLGGAGTRGYLIDPTGNRLLILGSLAGVSSQTDVSLTVLGPLGFDAAGQIGFDIGRVRGFETALASFSVGGVQGLYSLNLAEGNARALGTIGDGTIAITDIAISPVEVAGSVTVATNGRSATYPDLDGDTVTVTVNRGTLLASYFDMRAEGTAQVLETLDLRDPGFSGANVTITAKRGSSGDGQVNVGYIKATGNDLGAVKVSGDLGRIDAGGGVDNKKSMISLEVLSMGSVGFATQSLATLNNEPNGLISNLLGGVSKIVIRGNLDHAGIYISDGVPVSAPDAVSLYTVSTVTVLGDMIGGAAKYSGSVYVEDGSITTAKITGSLRGGSGNSSGALYADFSLKTGTIGGSLFGGSNNLTGAVAAGQATTLTIGGDILGGTANYSGVVYGFNFPGKLTVKGSLYGGAFEGSGSLVTVRPIDPVASDGSFGTVFIGGSLVGGAGKYSGGVQSANRVASFTADGTFYGNGGDYSGALHCEQLGKAVVTGSLLGGAGLLSGSIAAEDSILTTKNNYTSSVTINGNIRTTGFQNTGLLINGKTGTVKINGSVTGEGPRASVLLRFSGLSDDAGVTPKNAADAIAIKSLTILGDVRQARILAGYEGAEDPLRGDVGIGTITIGGSVFATDIIAGVDPGADLIFGTADDELASPMKPGLVSTIGAVIVKGQLIGGGTGGQFNIIAGKVTSLRVGAVTIPLQGNAIDDFTYGITKNLRVLEIPGGF